MSAPDFVSSLWSKEIVRQYADALALGRGMYFLPPLTRWQRVKRFLKFYEARYRIRNAWACLVHGRELE